MDKDLLRFIGYGVLLVMQMSVALLFTVVAENYPASNYLARVAAAILTFTAPVWCWRMIQYMAKAVPPPSL